MAAKVRKLKSADVYPVDGFNKTVEYKILHCASMDGNANKYYVLEMQTDGKTFRLYSEYGRIGNANPARDLREGLTEDEAKQEFAKIIKSKSKVRTKVRKIKDGGDAAQDVKHQEQYKEVDIAAPTVGSPNIRQSGDGPAVVTQKKSGTSAIGAVFAQMGFQPSVNTLLGQLLAENVHNIESSTDVTVTHNGLATPLGPVTHTHLDTAMTVLNRLQAVTPTINGPSDSAGNVILLRDPKSKEIRDANSEFFSLIPHHFGSKLTDDDMLLSDDNLQNKVDLLEGMRAALTVTDAEDGNKGGPALPFEMMEIDSKHRVYKEIAERVRRTSDHHDVRHWRVKRIFAVCNLDELSRYRNPTRGGDEFHLFHGSANANLISIMLRGFYVPPTTASHVTGRMFGNGVYGASKASKSFRYSVGAWGGRRSRMKTAYLFVCKFAMGKTHIEHSMRTSGAPSGYHSIWAKAGRSLMNDEFIVYNTNQTHIEYLIEMTE